MQTQQQQGLLTCPFCESRQVFKQLTPSRVGRKSNTNLSSGQQVTLQGPDSAQHYEQLQAMLRKVHDYVEQNFEDVGNRFTEEALSIHRGEKDPANIRGTANATQLKEMQAEGVQALPLPSKPVDKDKLN